MASYIARFKKMGLVIDQATLRHSYRCSPSVCEYIKGNLGIEIASHRDDSTDIRFLESNNEIQNIFANDATVKLFYKGYKNYSCYSNNWGKSKGLDCYSDVCVVLNRTTFKNFSNGNLSSLKAQTKNKLYVAITRTKGNLYFAEEAKIRKITSK